MAASTEIINALQQYKDAISRGTVALGLIVSYLEINLEQARIARATAREALLVASSDFKAFGNSIASITPTQIDNAKKIYVSKVNDAPLIELSLGLSLAQRDFARGPESMFFRVYGTSILQDIKWPEIQSVLLDADNALNKAKSYVPLQAAPTQTSAPSVQQTVSAPPPPVVLPGAKGKLKEGILAIYSAETLDDAFSKYDKAFKDFLFSQKVDDYVAKSVDPIKPLFQKSLDSKTFISDFGNNLVSWAKSSIWSNGQATRSVSVPPPLDFQSFSDKHKEDTNLNAYINSLVDFLYSWLSKIGL